MQAGIGDEAMSPDNPGRFPSKSKFIYNELFLLKRNFSHPLQKGEKRIYSGYD